MHRKPVITTVFPSVVSENDVVTILGNNFGKADSGNGLRFGEDFFSSAQCISWEDEKITFTVPKNFSSTLLSVTDGAESSQKVIITQRTDIPEILHQELSTVRPEITSLSRANGGVGQTITIYGSHFGNTRQNSQVIFTDVTDTFLNETSANIEGTLCLEENFDFISWSDKEINIHVPDGARSGSLVVQTPAGLSNPVPFTVSSRVGKKTISNKRTITLSLSASLQDFTVRSRQNSLFLYTAKPIPSYRQTNPQLLSTDSSVFAASFQGSTIYKFENITETSKIAVSETLSLETYDVKVSVEPSLISANIRLKPEIKQYTNATALVQSDSQAVKNLASSIIGNTTNPYTNARKIYQYLLEEITASSRVSTAERPIDDIIASRFADSYELSLLYCALLRASNIPCVQIAGIVIADNQTTYNHWWNEFYIDELGWIPVDVGMAMGVPFKRDDTNESYFAGLDGLHIAFSSDIQFQTQMLSESTIVNKSKAYCLRHIWEESIGLVAYNALWPVPKVISVY